MRPRNNKGSRSQKSESVKGEGPNWMLVAGGAVVGSFIVHFGCKLKQALEARHLDNARLKGNRTSADTKRSGTHPSHPIVYTYEPVEDCCVNCNSGVEGMDEIKKSQNGQILTESEGSLSLVTVPAHEYNRANGVVWTSSPDRLELPPKPFIHHSNCSDSPCASDSGSDIFTKREVIQKLRQHLKKRDDMILEMQDQIAELQNAHSNQVSHSNNLQSQLDSVNRELFDSDREIQRLRKAIADHCIGHGESCEKNLPSEESNGHVNGYVDGVYNLKMPEKSKEDAERIGMLRREIGELKEVIEGKEFLVQSYKEQKSELSVKIRELQWRLDSQLPNIL